MKPIIIDMTEMSDSKEVYESRPHPFFMIFIYLIMVLTIAVIIWATLFKIDIVVKGVGIISAKEDLSTITNTFAGDILTVNFKDGQTVKAGDILYTVASPDYDLEEDEYNKQLKIYKDKIEATETYLEWLHDDKSDIEIINGNPNYDEFEARQKVLMLGMNQVDNQLSAQSTSYDNKVASNQDMIAYYNNEINKLSLLSAGIQTLTNPFEESDSYYYAKLNSYLTERKNIIAEYDDALDKCKKEIDRVKSDISNEKEKINNANDKIRNANGEIDSSKNEIEETKRNASQTETVMVEETNEDGETVLVEVIKNIINEDEANNIIYNKENIIAEMRSEINANEAKKSSAENMVKSYEATLSSKEDNYTTISIQKKTAIDNLEKQTIASVEASIVTYKQSIASLRGTISETQSAKHTLLTQGTGLDKEKIIQNEIENVSAELSNYKAQASALEAKLLQIANAKENAIVKAPISGTINLVRDIIPGNYLNAGVDVLTILPLGTSLQVESYISNEDIAKISNDMEVKYEIAAFPSSEYGNIQGNVEFVSADLKANSNDGSAYYSVHSSLDNTVYRNEKGEKTELKVGMACQSKIIVEQKTVLKFIMEKIHLVD